MRESIGDSYIESDFSALDKMLGELGRSHFVDVGILGENGSKTDAGGATLAMIGAVHEFGPLKDPSRKRSFILMPLQTHQDQIQRDVEPRFAKHIGEGDVHGIFVDIGIAAEGQIQDAFDTGGFGTWKPLEQSTIDAKGSDAILIDTGALRRAVSSKAGTV